MATISGVWKWKSTITLPSSEVYTAYGSAGSCQAMFTMDKNIEPSDWDLNTPTYEYMGANSSIIGIREYDSSSADTTYRSASGWITEAGYYMAVWKPDENGDRIINWGTTAKTVTDAFYTWFTANAEVYTPPVIEKNITTTEGITLATYGKYCSKDIKVTPDATSKANLVAGNIKKDVSILGVTGTYEGSSSSGATLNLAYGETAPADTSKRWVKCAKPSKEIIDNRLVVEYNDSDMNTYYNYGSSTSFAGVRLYNGIRWCVSLNQSGNSGIYYIKVKDKDSNNSFQTFTQGSNSSGDTSYYVCGYVNYKDKVFAAGSKSYWATGVYSSKLVTYSRDTEGNLIANEPISFAPSSTSGYVATFSILSVSDTAVYYAHGRTTIYEYNFKTGQRSTLSYATYSSTYTPISRGIFYNNKIYFFRSSGLCCVIDLIAKTQTNSLSTGVTPPNYATSYIAQMKDKFYWQVVLEDHSDIKCATADTWEIKTVCQVPITKMMFLGVYDEESETLMLSDEEGSYIFNINDFAVNNGELVLTTDDKKDYPLINSDSLVYYAEPKIGLLGDSSNKGQRVNVYHYNESSGHWVLYGDPQLATPTISILSGVLSWSAVENATKYKIYSGVTLVTTVTTTSVDLSTLSLSAGLNAITVKASCDAEYLDSAASNEVGYVVGAITLTISGTTATWTDTATTDAYDVRVENASSAATTTNRVTGAKSLDLSTVTTDSGTYYVTVLGVYTLNGSTVYSSASNTGTFTYEASRTITINATGEHFTVSYDLDAGQTREGNVITGAAGTTVSVHFVADDGYELGEISHTTTSGTVTDIQTNSSGDYNIEFADSDAVITFEVTTQAASVTLTGQYQLNETITITDAVTEEVDFTCQGASYNGFISENSNTKLQYRYYDSDMSANMGLDVYTDGAFIDSGYRIVDFGSMGVQVSSAFNTWLMANATVYVEPTDALAGTWVFKDTSIMLEAQNFTFNFVSGGKSYDTLEIDSLSDVLPNEAIYMYYLSRDVSAEPVLDTVASSSGIAAGYPVWIDEVYKTIVITSKLSEVTNGEALLTWLQANATKQT